MIEIDKKIFLSINSLNSAWLDSVMVVFSGQIFWLPVVAYIIYLGYKQNSKINFSIFIFFILLALIASDVTSSYIFKNIFQRMRPCRLVELQSLIHQFGQKCGGKYGFVSSHAANSITVVTLALSYLDIKSKAKHLLWLMPLFIGYSRIYLGVHYPGDILGGYLVGIVYGCFFAFVLKNSWSKTA